MIKEPTLGQRAVYEGQCNNSCQDIQTVYEAMFTLETSLRESIQDIVNVTLSLLPDYEPPQRTRGRRRWFDFVGIIGHHLFGLSTDWSVNQLRGEMTKIIQASRVATSQANSIREGMVSFTKIQNDRMDNFRRILSNDHTTITGLYVELRSMADTLRIESNAIAKVCNDLANYVKIHDSLQTLLSGVEESIHGLFRRS